MDLDATTLWIATRSTKDYSALLDAGAHTGLMVGPGKAGWEFVTDYVAKHGALPGIGLVVENSGTAIRPPEDGQEVAVGFLLERLRERATRRALAYGLGKGLEALEADKQEDAVSEVLKLSEHLADISLRSGAPRRSTVEQIDAHLAHIQQRWGQRTFGISIPSFPQIEDALSGLWGSVLLSAAPNAGKTCLAGQLALDALATPDVQVVIISMEMTTAQMWTRFLAQVSGRTTREITLGSNRAGVVDPFLRSQLGTAAEKLKLLAPRLAILDRRALPEVTSATIRRSIARLSETSGARRTLLIIDSLQRLPGSSKKGATELDDDRERYELIQGLRFALTDDDCILTISEARKPASSKGRWAAGMADVRGHAGLLYVSDAVAMLTARDADPNAAPGTPSLADFTIAKVRDPGYRASIPLTFDFVRSRFAERIGVSSPITTVEDDDDDVVAF